MIVIHKIPASDPGFRELVQNSNNLMYELYGNCVLEEGDKLDNYLDDWTVLDQPNVDCIGAYDADGNIVGIGAIKNLGEYGELKRIFVDDKCRGGGVGELIVTTLEHFAKTTNLNMIKLETGTEQPAAIGLFKKLGYTECGHFGCYGNHPESVYMEKILEEE